MKSNITKHGSGLDISVEHVGDRQQALVDAFQECQEGRCSCETSEYEKLASIDVQSADDGVRIQLRPRSGASIVESAVRIAWTTPSTRRPRGSCLALLAALEHPRVWRQPRSLTPSPNSRPRPPVGSREHGRPNGAAGPFV